MTQMTDEKASSNKWSLLDALGKRLTVILEVAETMKDSVQKSYIQLHAINAKQLCNELKSTMVEEVERSH